VETAGLRVSSGNEKPRPKRSAVLSGETELNIAPYGARPNENRAPGGARSSWRWRELNIRPLWGPANETAPGRSAVLREMAGIEPAVRKIRPSEIYERSR